MQPPYECPDPRYTIRRATPADYPQIYSLVDEVWDRTRPKAQYEWLYVDNPSGYARATVVIERATGQMIAAGAGFPWPIAKADKRYRGTFGGDAVTIKRLQRQNIGDIKREFAETHPWRNSNIGLHAPNAKSRASMAKRGKAPAFGPLPVATLVLDCASYLRAQDKPKAVAHTVGLAADASLSLLHRVVLPQRSELRVVDIDRFDSGLEALSLQTMRSDLYWCPHDAAFLNWRFLSHPVFEYRAVGLTRGDEWQAFAVFKITGDQAALMEFVAPDESLARPLLRAVNQRARESGCNRIRFYNLPNWEYWPLLYRAGYRPRQSEVYIGSSCEDRDDVKVESNWRLMPSDSDVT